MLDLQQDTIRDIHQANFAYFKGPHHFTSAAVIARKASRDKENSVLNSALVAEPKDGERICNVVTDSFTVLPSDRVIERIALNVVNQRLEDFLALRALHSQPIIIQNTAEAASATASKQETQQNTAQSNIESDGKDGVKKPQKGLLTRFWGVPLNRGFVVSAIFFTLYMAKEAWLHNQRMRLLQQKIDASVVLKLTQVVGRMFGDAV